MTTQEATKYWKVFLKEIDFLKKESSSIDWKEQEEATKKAIEALKNEAMNEQIMWERNIAFLQLEEIGVELGAKMDVVKEAMEKQISIKKVIERLEEMEGTCNGHKCGKDGCAGCVDCKIEKAYAEAIAIIKEEVG